MDSDSPARSDTGCCGTAWAAIEHLMLTDDVLGGCPLIPDTS